jgi:hypothetical protein
MPGQDECAHQRRTDTDHTAQGHIIGKQGPVVGDRQGHGERHAA